MNKEIEAEFIELNEAGETVSKSVEHIEIDLGLMNIRKEQQTQFDDQRGHQWVEPRYKFDTLLSFMELNVWHARCIQLKANLVGGLGWELVTDAENKDEDLDYRRIIAFLNKPNPNATETFTELCKRFLIDFYAVGNAWFEASRNLKQEPVELYHVRAMTMKRAKNIRNGGYLQVINGFKVTPLQNWRERKTDVNKNEALHFFSYDPQDDFYGVPSWIANLGDIMQDRGYVEYTMNLFRNQLLAKFLIVVEGGTLSKAAKQNIRKFLQHHTGVKNAGGTIVLESEDPNVKIRIEKIDHEFLSKDQGSNTVRTISRDVVVASHGVLPRLVGVMSAGQLGGGSENEAQLKSFKETVIDPDQNSFEEFLNRTLIKAFGTHKWKIKFNEFDITTMAEDASFYEKALDPAKGWMKRNEVREKSGLAALDEFEESPGAVQGSTVQKMSEIRKSIDFAFKRLSPVQDL